MDKPFPAYAGSESYVVVSYSHADADRVYPEIRRIPVAYVENWIATLNQDDE